MRIEEQRYPLEQSVAAINGDGAQWKKLSTQVGERRQVTAQRGCEGRSRGGVVLLHYAGSPAGEVARSAGDTSFRS
jgi:hypothetical protein